MAFTFLSNKFNIIIFKSSPNVSTKNISNVLYIDFIIGISIRIIILVIRSILIIMCIPKYIGSHLTKKVNIDNTMLESIYLGILIGLLEIICTPHTIINNSGRVLKKNSIQLSFNIYQHPFSEYNLMKLKTTLSSASTDYTNHSSIYCIILHYFYNSSFFSILSS